MAFGNEAHVRDLQYRAIHETVTREKALRGKNVWTAVDWLKRDKDKIRKVKFT